MSAILIVEDEGIVARDLELTLQRMEYGVSGVVGSGEEAIERLDTLRPDLVLMDIRLQGPLDGIETAERIRERADIPIIYLTSFADDETILRAKLTEPYGYVVKPFNGAELRSIVEVALYKHSVERGVRENEAGLAATLASIGDGVITTDVHGRVERMNPAAERLTGWALEQAKGQPVDDVCQLHDATSGDPIPNPAMTALAGTGAGGLDGIVEGERATVLLSRAGTVHPVAERASRIADPRGTVRGAVVVFEDVTNGRRRERELEATKTRLQHLLTANPAIVYTREATEGARLTFISDDVKAQLGHDPAALTRDPEYWRARVHPDDRPGIDKALSEPSPFTISTCEYRFMNANRSYRWLHDAFRLVLHAGEPDEIVGCLVDVTNQKYTEFLLARQTRRLERSNKELEEFAYVASHDLRAPLRAISTLSEWIQADLGDALTGEAREQMGLLRGRVQRMDRLLLDLLEYSRVGREELSTELVDLQDLLAEVIDLSNAPKGFRFESEPDLPRFETAKVPLKRVLLNLVNNAVKHHDRPEGFVRLGARDIGDSYELSVADDGPGVPVKFHERIFQMFQTLRPRDVVEGSGMGLALVRRIVEGAGGRVWIDSQDTRGSTFRFTWPKIWHGGPTTLAGGGSGFGFQVVTPQKGA